MESIPKYVSRKSIFIRALESRLSHDGSERLSYWYTEYWSNRNNNTEIISTMKGRPWQYFFLVTHLSVIVVKQIERYIQFESLPQLFIWYMICCRENLIFTQWAMAPLFTYAIDTTCWLVMKRFCIIVTAVGIWWTVMTRSLRWGMSPQVLLCE